MSITTLTIGMILLAATNLCNAITLWIVRKELNLLYARVRRLELIERIHNGGNKND